MSIDKRNEHEKNYKFKKNMTARDIKAACKQVQELQDQYPHRKHETAIELLQLAEKQLESDK